MKGKYRIVVENKKIKYDFEIKRNLTVIKGDSATGKTTLVDMIAEYYEQGPESGIQLRCEKICAVLSGRDWKNALSAIHDSIVFIDEGNSFVRTKEFASEIKKTDNYYVIVTRESLPALPYSVTEIYGIRDSGKYGTLKQKYNEMYRIYGDFTTVEIHPDKVITEDSGAGFQFFDAVCKEHNLECESAFGKSNVFRVVEKLNTIEQMLIVADGAAFGPEMDKIMSLIHIRPNVSIYLPESFEWLILNAKILESGYIKQALTETYNYAESSIYESWEQFFTELLIKETKSSVLTYSKKMLNPAYLGEKYKTKILSKMEKIHFEK